MLISVYYDIIFSYLSHAVLVWGGGTLRTLFLPRFQRKIFYSDLLSLPRQHPCKEIFRTYKILTFPSIYILKTLLLMRKHPLCSVSHPVTVIHFVVSITVPVHSTYFFKNCCNILPSNIQCPSIVTRVLAGPQGV